MRMIKFACIELYTKSGKIWNGAREKPSHPCDPFECWASALGGERVPLMWFKLKNPLRQIYHNQFAPRISRANYSGYSMASKLANRAFDKFHNLEYLTKFDVVLVVVHDYSISAMSQLVTEAKGLKEKPIFLGTFGNTLEAFRKALKSQDALRHFKTFLDNCDAFVNCFHEAVSDYLTLYTDTPIVNFPHFYPVEFAKTFFTSYDDKEKVIFVSGHTQRIDHVFSLLVAKEIQARHPEYLIEVIDRSMLNLEPLEDSRHEIVPFLKWEDYLNHTSKTYMIVDMDNAWTLGRVPRDAAAVGTPCIGLNSAGQTSLFPDLACSDIIDSKRAVELGIKLIEDREFYEGVQGKALERLEAYSPENLAQRLNELVEGIGND